MLRIPSRPLEDVVLVEVAVEVEVDVDEDLPVGAHDTQGLEDADALGQRTAGGLEDAQENIHQNADLRLRVRVQSTRRTKGHDNGDNMNNAAW